MSAIIKPLFWPTCTGVVGLINAYERSFASTIVGDDIPALAFWRGRVALWTILRAVGITEGDEVILPAYTCEMVPIALKFAGARCIYADVSQDCFSASCQETTNSLTFRTRVVICQHTYGIPQPVRQFESLLQGKEITLVEDCCQLIPNGSTPHSVGMTGAASFFSTQWNKPFSTGLGGMAVFRDRHLHAVAEDIRAAFSTNHDRHRARSLAIQILLYKCFVRPKTRATIGRIYRWARRSGRISGTNTADEYGDTMPSNYLGCATHVQALFGLRELRRWPDNVRHRRLLTSFYLEHLPSLGVDTTPLKAGSEKPVLWAVPLLVENKDELLRLAERRGLPIETWFDRTPVHVHPATASRYDYIPGQCPRSEQMFSREIHLPTSLWVTLRLAKKTVTFLRRFAHFANLDG